MGEEKILWIFLGFFWGGGGSAAESGRAARKGVPLRVDGPPARGCRWEWTGRPQGISLEGGRAETSGTSETSGRWQGARLRATPFTCAKQMLPRHAIHLCEARKPIPCAKRHPRHNPGGLGGPGGLGPGTFQRQRASRLPSHRTCAFQRQRASRLPSHWTCAFQPLASRLPSHWPAPHPSRTRLQASKAMRLAATESPSFAKRTAYRSQSRPAVAPA